MGAPKTSKIDGQKLRKLILEQGITIHDAGIKAGYSRSWIDNAILKNYVNKPMLVFLEREYGIKLSDILPDKPKATAPKEEQIEEPKVLYVRDMTQGDLYETIFDAVKDALKG